MSHVDVRSVLQPLKDVSLTSQYLVSVAHMYSKEGTCKRLEDPHEVLDGVDPEPLKHALFTKPGQLTRRQRCQGIEPYDLSIQRVKSHDIRWQRTADRAVAVL